MTSQINPNVPVAGNPTTASVRANFATAAQEITTLQNNTQGAPFLPLAGAQMRGPINLFNDPTAPMHPVTLGYFQANGGGGGSGPGGVPEAPADGTLYGRQDGAWLHAVDTAELDAAINTAPFLLIAGGSLTGPLLLAADPTQALGAATKQYADNNFLKLAGGTLTGPLILAADPTTALGAATKQYIDVRNFVSQIGPSPAVAVVENSTGANKMPTITGNATPQNVAYDGLALQATRLTTPFSTGSNADGPLIMLCGPSNTNHGYAYISSGTNAAGYQTFGFSPSGTLNIPNAVVVNINNSFGNHYLGGNNFVEYHGFAPNYYWQFEKSSAILSYISNGVSVFSYTPTTNTINSNGPLSAPSLQGGAGINNAGTLRCWNSTATVNFHWVGGYTNDFRFRINEANDILLPNQTNATMFYFQSGSGPIGIFLGAGDMSGNGYGINADFASDERIKENIIPTTVDALAVLQAVPVSEFDVKADAATWLRATGASQDVRKLMLASPQPVHVSIGFVAQRIQPHIPEAVYVLPVAAAPPESPIPADRQNIVPEYFVPYLVRAVQQLADRVVALEAIGA